VISGRKEVIKMGLEEMKKKVQEEIKELKENWEFLLQQDQDYVAKLFGEEEEGKEE